MTVFRGSLTGTGALVRLALRRDRILLPVWIVILALTTISVASAVPELYPTAGARQDLALGMGSNPAIIAMAGPGFDLSTIGGITAWRMGLIGAVLIAFMNIFLVSRHTRADEEAGRTELVGSAVVGRHAPLTSALIVVGLADLLIGLVIAAGLVGQDLPAAGSFALGLSITAEGWAFAAIAAVAAQLTESSRTANGIASAAIGVAFLLRAAGDSAGVGATPGAPFESGFLSWLSPIGWAQQVRPFADERWWVLLLPAAFAVGLVAVAFALAARRDVGAGLIRPRPGPAAASASLRSPLALALRLQRGSLIGWTVGLLVMGAAYGSITSSIGDLLNDSPQMKELMESLGGGGSMIDSYLAAIYGLLGLIASGFAISSVLRLRSEETALRAEPVVATAVSRWKWTASHLVCAALGTIVILLAAGLGAGLAYGLDIGDVGGQLPSALAGTLVQAPAALAIGGLAAALFGVLPRLSMLAWGALVIALLLGQLGGLLQLDQWVMDISPFSHVPQVPASDVAATPLVALSAIAVGLTAIGLVGFRRRDVG